MYQLFDIQGNIYCNTGTAKVTFTWNIISYVEMSKWKFAIYLGFEDKGPQGRSLGGFHKHIAPVK